MFEVIRGGVTWVIGFLMGFFLFRAIRSFLRGVREGVRLNLIKSYLLSDTQVRYFLGVGEPIYMECAKKNLFFEVQVRHGKLCFWSANTGQDIEFPCGDAEFPIRVINSLMDEQGMLCYRKQAMAELRNGGFELEDAK